MWKLPTTFETQNEGHIDQANEYLRVIMHIHILNEDLSTQIVDGGTLSVPAVGGASKGCIQEGSR